MQKFLEKYKERFNLVLRYGVIATILAIALIPKFPFIDVPGTHVSVRIEDFLILFIVSVAILSIKYSKHDLSSPIARAFLIFWGIGALSLFSGIFLTQTVSPSLGFLHWARRIQYMSMFFVGFLYYRKRSDITFLLTAFCVVILYSFVYGVGQKYFQWPIITTQNEEYAKGVALRFVPGGHIVGTFAGHYDMASVLIILLTIALPFIVATKETYAKLGIKLKPLLITNSTSKKMFNSEQFTETWQLWKKHKKELSGNPYTQTAEEKALATLFQQSHGIEDLAIQSINESMNNNWAKIYIVKNYNNGTGQASENNGQFGFRNSVQEELNKRFGGGR